MGEQERDITEGKCSQQGQRGDHEAHHRNGNGIGQR